MKTDELSLIITHCDNLLSSHKTIAAIAQTGIAYTAGFQDAVDGVRDFVAALKAQRPDASVPMQPRGDGADVDDPGRSPDHAPALPGL
jgi:hypothetical protein